MHVDFPGGLLVKDPPAKQEKGLIPELGRSPGEENGTHSSSLAWEIPWAEKAGRLQSMGSQKSQILLSD